MPPTSIKIPNRTAPGAGEGTLLPASTLRGLGLGDGEGCARNGADGVAVADGFAGGFAEGFVAGRLVRPVWAP
jgi:hypothetical protein